MPVKNLTAPFVSSVKPPEGGQVDYWDKQVQNFGLRVSASGRRTWTVYYRFHRQKRRFTLGTYPAVVLKDARKRAKKALDQVAAGIDPAAAARFERHEGKTFGELATEYLERHAKKQKKSWKSDERLLKRELLPKWRQNLAKDIKRADVRDVVEGIADRGAGVLANRVLALISKMFNFAIERDWVEQNPRAGVRRPTREESRDRMLTPDEIRRVWTAAEQQDPPFRTLFRLRLLTAQRGGELQRMRWPDVDLDNGWWSIPAEHAKNGLSHRVPLSEFARRILEEHREWQIARLNEINRGRLKKKWEIKKPSAWVFPSYRGAGPLEWMKRVPDRIRKASGVDFRPHDLRRTAASVMTANGVPRLVVKKILNHVDRDITAVYDRFAYEDEKRKAVELLADVIQKTIDADTSEGSNVVQMRSRSATKTA